MNTIAAGKANEVHTHSYNDLIEKPIYDEERIVELVPETLLTITDSAAYVDYKPLNIGATYIVTYNNVEYECECKVYSEENMIVPVLGNLGVLTGEGVTSEPFLIMSVSPEVGTATGLMPNGALGINDLEGNETVTISIISNELVSKLDNKYLDLEWLPITKNTTLFNQTVSGFTVGSDSSVQVEAYFAFIENSNYIVTIDGVVYECQGELLENVSEVYIGNSAVLGMLGGVDNGLPFFMMASNGILVIILYDNQLTEHSIIIELYDPNPIPKKFLPSDIDVSTTIIREW